ncbi:hypothetical protein JAAARDRAFT_156282 [Jaapia argillacea MUCL 33604]|uniref:DUF1746 domain-containing protein n=1 Tax=Jaapia argillacea MUCL 33604 TaxID=933084 RepID=A0A067Q221_9AGAM|nr:hypothetical protein JAAARDRAFT_156282 [Jaapia argillacea MUCL 33604]
MQIRHHAQRQHIIQSLDTLLYHLHTLSFFLSPRIWALLCRVTTQFQFSRPRLLDPKRSLRFWFFLIVFFNAGALWSHATEGAPEGRGVILDFVGMSYRPSKGQLLFLDLFIILLQMVLTTIAYETSLSEASSTDTPDPLLPKIPTSGSFFPSLSRFTSTYSPLPTNEDPDSHSEDSPQNSKSPPITESPYIFDLRLSLILSRIRTPAPLPTPPVIAETGIPLPNTTGATRALPAGLRMLLRARRELRTRADRTNNDRPQGAAGGVSGTGGGRVPGALDLDDGG